MQSNEITPETPVILALDMPSGEALKRTYLFFRAQDLNSQESGVELTAKSLDAVKSSAKVFVFLYPTKTYSEGMGGSLLTDVSPEDRVFMRAVEKKFPKRAVFSKIDLSQSQLFEKLPKYFKDDSERSRFETERKALEVLEKSEEGQKKSLVGFYPKLLENMVPIFKSCMTRPNKQDYFYLATKTFGINLIVRVLFAVKGVRAGQLPLFRALASTCWYQFQDIIFTLFGQTYMKFLGRMTGLLRVGQAYLGDFFFVYIQLSLMEFTNRLILGPIGENPLVYTWKGVGLILFNNFQGMISGGPLTPAFNKMRRAGVISHSTMMHLYQLGSLTMFFGLFASYGYQFFYTVLTTTTLVFAWGAYIVFSVLYRDPSFNEFKDVKLYQDLDHAAALSYAKAI